MDLMAVCEWCGREMNPPSACTVETYRDFADGIERTRVRWGAEADWPHKPGEPCGDCLTPWGELHHPGCDIEECPRCGGQAMTCGCTESVND